MRRLALVLPASCSALLAHALVYGGWSAHRYFRWYEPLVAAASLAGLAVFVAAGRRLRLGAPDPRALALATFAFLFVQESLEQHRVVSLTPSQLVLLLAAVALTSLVVAFALRAVRCVLSVWDRVVPTTAALGWTVVAAALRSPRPLALSRALRGPPPLAA